MYVTKLEQSPINPASGSRLHIDLFVEAGHFHYRVLS